MQRHKQTVYTDDTGHDLVKLQADGRAHVVPATCGVETLDELALACAAAAEELRARAESEQFAEKAT